MFSACGPERRSRCPRQLALDEPAVEVEEGRCGQPVGDRVVEQAPQRRLGDRPAAEPRDHGRHVRPEGLRAPRRTSSDDDPADAGGERLLEHDDAAGVAERLAHLVHRPRPEGLDPDRADLHAVLAHLVDVVLDRPEHRAERDDDRLGVLGAVAAHEAAGAAAERRSKSAAICGIRSSACICLTCARYFTSMNASGPTIAPIVTGSAGSSTWRGSNGGRNASTAPASACRRARRRV